MKPFVMHHVTISPSRRCNLNCKLCGTGSPYYINPKIISLDRLKETVDRFFLIASYVEKFSISGGEPLLYKDLPLYVDYLSGYGERIGTLEIVTNGTIVPSEALLESLMRLRTRFCFIIDNYGLKLSKKVDEIDKLLATKGIPYRILNYTQTDTYYNGWVDFGDLSVKKLHTKEEIEEHCGKCAHSQKLKWCFPTIDGLMYPCPPAQRCVELGSVNNYNEYIDLFDDALSVEDQRQKIQAIYSGKSLEACAWCNGLREDSQRFMPAEQLSAEEIRAIRGKMDEKTTAYEKEK